MIAFFTPEAKEYIIGQDIILSSEESWHGAKVLRIKSGEEVLLLNGKGKQAIGIISKVHDSHTSVTVQELKVDESENPYKLHLAISVLKTNDRMEWMLEKLIELGVASITFITCNRTERNKINLERMQKIAIATIKQCKRSWLPEIQPVMNFEHYINQNLTGQKYIAYCEANAGTDFLNNQTSYVVIGPEGDFTEAEIQLAYQSGFQPVLISNQILRSETAAISIAAKYDCI